MPDPLRAEFGNGTKYWYPWNVGVPRNTAARFAPAEPEQPPSTPPAPPPTPPGTPSARSGVFAAILVMSLIGNLFARVVRPARLEPYYAGLFASLAIGLAVPASAFLGLSPVVQVLAVCAVAFTPVAFAGVVFATTFMRTAHPDRVFGMNVAGALCGGLAENASVLLGFRWLLCVAVGFYLLSAFAGARKLPAAGPERRV